MMTLYPVLSSVILASSINTVLATKECADLKPVANMYILDDSGSLTHNEFWRQFVAVRAYHDAFVKLYGDKADANLVAGIMTLNNEWGHSFPRIIESPRKHSRNMFKNLWSNENDPPTKLEHIGSKSIFSLFHPQTTGGSTYYKNPIEKCVEALKDYPREGYNANCILVTDGMPTDCKSTGKQQSHNVGRGRPNTMSRSKSYTLRSRRIGCRT